MEGSLREEEGDTQPGILYGIALQGVGDLCGHGSDLDRSDAQSFESLVHFPFVHGAAGDQIVGAELICLEDQLLQSHSGNKVIQPFFQRQRRITVGEHRRIPPVFLFHHSTICRFWQCLKNTSSCGRMSTK